MCAHACVCVQADGGDQLRCDRAAVVPSRCVWVGAHVCASARMQNWLAVNACYIAAEPPWQVSGKCALLFLRVRMVSVASGCGPALALATESHFLYFHETFAHPLPCVFAVFPSLVSFVSFAYVMKELQRMIHSALREANTTHSRAWWVAMCVGPICVRDGFCCSFL